MKNENKIDEMVQILSSLHKYVPSTQETLEVEVEGEEEPDQLTVNRILFWRRPDDSGTCKECTSTKTEL